MGMLRSCLLASAPSASTHAAPAWTPHSRSSVATGTPVHSLQLVRPWIRCTSDSVEPPRHSPPLLPEHSRKMDARDRRQAADLVDGEDERAIDEAVDRQRVRRRIDLGDAGMMALEVERRRRDDPVGVVQRRPARGFLERHLRILVEVARGLLEFRARSVRADRRAQRARLGGRRRRRLDWHATSAALQAAPSPRNQRRERECSFSMAAILSTRL